MNNALGVDVFHGDGIVDWAKILSYGQSFAFAKASQGISGTDSMFKSNWNGMGAVGITRGAYHFFDPAKDGIVQANHLLAQVTLIKSDLPFAIDVEVGKFSKASEKRLADCLDVLEKATGKIPIIYTGPAYWNEQVAPKILGQNMDRYPLWISHYTSATKPIVPKGWNDWSFWQFDEAGQNGHTYDVNRYNGTHGDLVGRFRLA